MKPKRCAIFMFDGYADWEPALAIAGLKKYGNFAVDSFSTDGQPIKSMGGLGITPTHQLEQIASAEYDLLILPGGEAWENGENTEVIPLIQDFLEAGKQVAAICGATVILAKMGVLNSIPHTSNMKGYLPQLAPEYQGEVH